VVEISGKENSYVRIADDDWQRSGLGFPGGLIWMVPYFRDPVRQKKAFAEAAADARSHKLVEGGKPSVKILAFHNEVTGCERNAYSKGTGLTLDEVGTDTYDLCVSGHIHRPQIVFKPSASPGSRKAPADGQKRVLGALNAQERASYGFSGAVIYPGSPFSTSWGEVNEVKELMVASINEKAAAAKIQLSWVPSVVPGLFDPDAPNFFVPKTGWKGTRVRVRVPIVSDQVMELKAARARLEKKYEGADLVLVPEIQRAAAVEQVDIKGGDAAILRRYLEKVELPEETTIEQMEAFIRKHLPSGGGVGLQGITLGKVSAANVLCFEKAELDFDQRGLTLVTGTNHDWPGSNGAGKSSLTTLPFLALFGRTFKGQTFDGWARQGTEAAAKVETHLTLAGGRKLRVVRGRRPNNFRAYLDDKEISMGDANATQAAVERLTGLTWSVLTNAVYVGQRDIGSVFGTDKERKELFSRLLGLERFIEAEAKIRKALLRCKRAVEEVEMDVSYSDSALIEASSGTLEIVEALASSAKVSPKDITSKEREMLEQATAKNNAQKAIDSIGAWMDENQKAFEKLLFKATDLEVRMNHLIDRRKELSGLQGDCPTCGTRVDVARLEKNVKQLSTQIDALELELESYDAKKDTNRDERQAKSEQRHMRQREWETAVKKHSALMTEWNQLREQLDSRQRLEGILNSKQARVKTLQRTKSVHERARLACIYEQRFVEACLSAVGRDGLPAFLASATAPALNSAAQRYSEIFSDGKIGVSFEMSGGEIDLPKIHNEGGGESFRDQSAGESRMAAIITVFAFMDTMSPANALILDEPAEGLDSVNAAAFAKGLSKVTDRFKHCVLISHNPYILGEVSPDREWQVEKRNGIATVKEI
jgi:ABC-type transport system involved in cytochrome c biogenesis ATPase subunit